MRKKIITFLYHEVVDDISKSGFQNLGALPYKHNKSHFLSDLDIIMSNFSGTELVTNIDFNDKENNLILTFDDGGVSALLIANILKERNLIGHFFITTSMIGKDFFLNVDQIIKIRKMGHIIGSHSHSHPNIFRDISYNQKVFEWAKSKNILEEILNEEIICASIPGGDMDKDSIKAAAEAGIKYLFTSEPTFFVDRKFGVAIFGRVYPKNTTDQKKIKEWSIGKGYFKSLLVMKIKEFIRIKFRFIYKLYLKYTETKFNV